MECKYICKFLCAYLDEELSLEKAEVINEHLSWCNSCREELEIQLVLKSLVHERFGYVKAPDSLLISVISELEHAEEYRESGIQALDLIRWGTHVAQLYKDKEDLKEVLVPYISMGLEQNEMCMWITCCISEEEVKESLKSNISNIQNYIDKGQLRIISYKDWYLKNGCFDCQCTLESSFHISKQAISCGYSGIRITGDSAWLDESNWSNFMKYENQVNASMNGQKILILCTYMENGCSHDHITDVINTHKYVLSKTEDSWMIKRTF